jgi:hypothetical protein
MQEDAGLSSTNKMPSSSKLRMSNIYHIDLQQLGKNKVVFTLWIYGYCCNFSHSIPTFYPNQGYLLRFLVLTHHRCATSTMVPPRSHTNVIPLHVQNLRLRPPLCIISPQHQYQLESNTRKNTMLVMV